MCSLVVESRWLVCLTQSVSGGVSVSVNANGNVKGSVSLTVSVKVKVSESVIVRLMLRGTALPIQAMANVSRRNQMGKTMLEAEHARVDRNGLKSSNL